MSKRPTNSSRANVIKLITKRVANHIQRFKVNRTQLRNVVDQLATDAVAAQVDDATMVSKLPNIERYRYKRKVLAGIKRLMYFKSGGIDLRVTMSYRDTGKVINEVINAYYAVVREELTNGRAIYIPNVCYITPRTHKVGAGTNPFNGQPILPHMSAALSINSTATIRAAMRNVWLKREGY